MTFYCLTVLAISATLASAGESCSGSQTTAGQKVHLLGIGVDSYMRTGGFESSEKEVRDLVAALAIKMCIPSSQITIIGRAAPPNRTNIVIAYTATLKRMKPGQTLILIYAGHGFEIDGVFYLVPQDAYFDEKSLEANRAGSISLPSLIEIEREYGRDVIFLLDGCRTFPIKLPGAKSTVLYATQEGESSYEVGGHGLFLPRITARIHASGPLVLSEFPTMAQQATAAATAAGVGQRSALVIDVPPRESSKVIRATTLLDRGTASRREPASRHEGFADTAIRRVAWPEPLQPVF